MSKNPNLIDLDSLVGAPKAEKKPKDPSVKAPSNIAGFKYFADQHVLRVTFSSGQTYDYARVPAQVYEGFQKAESKGKYFYAAVRGKFDYAKLEK